MTSSPLHTHQCSYTLLFSQWDQPLRPCFRIHPRWHSVTNPPSPSPPLFPLSGVPHWRQERGPAREDPVEGLARVLPGRRLQRGGHPDPGEGGGQAEALERVDSAARLNLEQRPRRFSLGVGRIIICLNRAGKK